MSELLIYVKAFVVGGLICVVGQILMQTTKLTSARILVLFVVAGVILGVNQYGLLGALSGGVTNAAGGIAAAILFGLLNALIFKPHAKP